MNGAKSPSQGSSTEKLREKRQRPPDEMDDEIESLARNAKKVVSPTDIKRKPSKGALNGGRKIAITLGKK